MAPWYTLQVWILRTRSVSSNIDSTSHWSLLPSRNLELEIWNYLERKSAVVCFVFFFFHTLKLKIWKLALMAPFFSKFCSQKSLPSLSKWFCFEFLALLRILQSISWKLWLLSFCSLYFLLKMSCEMIRPSFQVAARKIRGRKIWFSK